MVIGADICCGSEISRVNAVVIYVQGNITFCYVKVHFHSSSLKRSLIILGSTGATSK